MPAIPLRSVRNTLRSPCDPHTDQPSIRLRSAAIPLLLSPLIPRADRSPALGRWARRSGDPKKGRDARRGKAARCWHACRNAKVGAGRRCIRHQPGRRHNRLRSCSRPAGALPMRFPISRYASQLFANALIALSDRNCRPICPNHVASIGKGFSRALSHELQHSWKLTRARESRRIACQMPWFGLVNSRIEGGRGEIPRALHNRRVIPISRRPPKIGGVLSETFRRQMRRLQTGSVRGE